MIPTFSWSGIFPQTLADRLAVIFSIVEILVEALALWIILPWKHPGYEGTVWYWLSATFGVFLLVNTLGNFFMTMGTDVSSRNTILPAALKPGWTYCHLCQQNAPPRSRHCGQCGRCVLKRDHHCIFTGCCIGYANQRYYLMCIMHIFLLSFFGIWLSVGLNLGNFSWKVLLASVAPLLGWLYGLTQPVSFFIAFQRLTGAYCFFIFITLCLYHGLVVLRGQTTHEYRRTGDRSYDLGWKQNVREVLGTRWYLVWIFPFIKSPLPGDGIYFTQRQE